MISVRHRTASGRLDAMWDFDPARGVVELVLRLGSAAHLAVSLKVCSPDRPRIWAHPIMRLDSESWRILPSLFIPKAGSVASLEPHDCGRGMGLRAAIPCALHGEIGFSQVVLTNAPDNIDLELTDLG